MHDTLERPATALSEELIAAADAMIPTLRARAAEDDAKGETRKATFDDLRKAGLTRILQPKRHGGLEQPLQVMARSLINLARGDQSAAWAYAVTQGHAHHLSMFDEQAQKDVWGPNPEALVASPYNPYGQATPYKDGYKLKGQWKFSSGCDHCDWYLLGGFVDGDESKFLTFLVDGKDVEIIEDWNVFGLKGTGSKSVRIEETYVPAYRTVPFGPGSEEFDYPGYQHSSNPALRIPYMLVFNRSITATSIGGLAGMIDEVVKYLEPKSSIITGKAVASHADTLFGLGKAKATFDELVILAIHDLNALEAIAARGEIPGEVELNSFRYRAQVAGQRCAEAARDLFDLAGGGGLYESLPIGRMYRNILAARNHPASDMYRDSARAIATNLFGGMSEKRRRF